MENLTLYLLPSLSAVAIKLTIFWYGRRSLSLETMWIWIFFSCLFMVNSIELISFLFANVKDPTINLFFLTLYYLFAVTASLAYLMVCLKIAGLQNRIITRIIYALISLGIVILVFPKASLLGVEKIGYSTTRIPGKLYWVIQLLLLIPWLLGPALLIYTAIKKDTWLARRRALSLLVGSLPTAISVTLVIVMMQAGFKINATVIVSFSLNILLFVMVFTERQYGLFRFLSNIPSTKENKLFGQIVKVVADTEKRNLAFLVSQFEHLLIHESLVENDGNKNQTAKALGVSRATLNRKLLSGAKITC